MKVIGLTGPAGAGKDTVVKILEQRGAYIIDVDKLAHEIYPLVLEKLIETFGQGILDKNGAVDRRKLGEIVFSDKNKLEELNKIVHPPLKEAIISATEKQKNLRTEELIVINAALPPLFERIVDRVWVILASREIRLKRVKNKKIIDVQASEEDYRKIADVIIENEGTIEELNAKVQANLKI